MVSGKFCSSVGGAQRQVLFYKTCPTACNYNGGSETGMRPGDATFHTIFLV